jgi:hypothetical protein
MPALVNMSHHDYREEPNVRFSPDMGIPVKVNIDSGGKPNGIPERR